MLDVLTHESLGGVGVTSLELLSCGYSSSLAAAAASIFACSLRRRSSLALAQIGFIVIEVGNRGGRPQRSKWCHNFGYGNLRDMASRRSPTRTAT